MRPRVEIEYCTQCRWLLRAAWLAQELLTTFEQELGEVALVPGTGGVLEVTARRGGDLLARARRTLPRIEGAQAVDPRPDRPG